ncbi:hypothetical protein NLU13_8986 [Sarocladium strictum]|uniref:Uncharacterized protein n=1 Tax=Sarocladium strictum TaxID=5046 RepID=A0AA39L3H3_SARSR|nr:hypothetical protein NLU13_8986 [Sarocladium strictum]
MSNPPRHFSTAARVHPGIVAHMPRPHTVPIKGLTTVAAVVVAAYGAKTYYDRALEVEAQRRNDSYREQQARNEQLMDMYGDRSSLAELERAVQHYEKK